MTAAPLHQVEFETEILRAIVDEYRGALADAMTCRLAVFGADPAFQKLAFSLARELSCDLAEAARLLHPTCQRIYRAALDAEVAHA